jgi:hypothetical protein
MGLQADWQACTPCSADRPVGKQNSGHMQIDVQAVGRQAGRQAGMQTGRKVASRQEGVKFSTEAGRCARRQEDRQAYN